MLIFIIFFFIEVEEADEAENNDDGEGDDENEDEEDEEDEVTDGLEKFLFDIGLRKCYYQKLVDEEIDLDILLCCHGPKDLKEIGVKNPVHRDKILEALESWEHSDQDKKEAKEEDHEDLETFLTDIGNRCL